MLVFWEERLAILATPKTGSTAIEAALSARASVSISRPPILKHTSARRFHRFVGPYLEVSSGQSFALAALMREPVDWLASWYRYRRRDDAGADRSTAGIGFDAFVRAYCREHPPEFAAVGSQARFLAPRNGRGVDHLFRYEGIAGFVAFLEDRLGCAIVLPRLNVSPVTDTQLDGATMDLLRAFCARDFALYDSIATA